MEKISLQWEAEWGQSMGLLLLLTLSPSSLSLDLALSDQYWQWLAVNTEELFLLCLPSGLLVTLLCPNQPELLCACMFGYYLCLSRGWWILHCWLLQTILSGLGQERKVLSESFTKCSTKGAKTEEKTFRFLWLSNAEMSCKSCSRGWSIGFAPAGDFGHVCWNKNKSGLGAGEAIRLGWDSLH